MATREYTQEERCKIIKYIVDNQRFTGLKGIAIWKEIEKANIINRTWQSMRTQFKGKILDLLHLFDITDEDRSNILNGTRKTVEKRTDTNNCSAPSQTTKRRRFSFSSDSDSDVTICTPKQTKTNETSSKPGEFDDEASSSYSPDLLFEVATNTAAGSQSDEPNQVPASAQQLDVIEIEDSDEEVNENNCDTVSFSLKDDIDLIHFFKNDDRLLNHINNDNIYTTFVLLYSSKKSCESLKERFLKHILPNLFTYDCLTTDQMLKFYDKSGLEVPEELKWKIRASPMECLNTTTDASVSVACSTDGNTADACTQTSEPPCESDKFNMFTVGKCIAVTQNGSVHAIVSENESNISPECIQDELIIHEENIHYVDTESLDILNSANQVRRDVDTVLKRFIGKFNCNLQNTRTVDETNLLITDSSESGSVFNTEITCNLFEDVEQNHNVHNESTATNTSSNNDDVNISDIIVPGTPQLIELDSAFEYRPASQLHTNLIYPEIRDVPRSNELPSTSISHESETRNTNPTTPQLFELDSAFEYQLASQIHRNLIYPQIRDVTRSNELPSTSISHESETRNTNDVITFKKLTKSSHVSYTKVDVENERSSSKTSDDLQQTQTTEETFYSACSQSSNTRN